MAHEKLNENKNTGPIGIAADHAGFEMKEYLLKALRDHGFEVIDYGAKNLNTDDDYPDYVIPLSKAIAKGTLSKGIAICGSGVGACITGNKVKGVRACLINEAFSAKQGVTDDDMNLLCLGARVLNNESAWQLSQIFLATQFSGLERHKRRLSKIQELENT
jgi:ribose 5-phosphate isomerase B